MNDGNQRKMAFREPPEVLDVPERVMNVLRSIFELSEEDKGRVGIAIVDRIITQAGGDDVQSWNLVLFGERFEALTSDPFSFHGDFLSGGLHQVVLNILDPVGLVSSSPWVANHDASGFYTIIDRVGCREAG